MKVVVGLGNPGKRYEKTRHNVGFEVADALVAGQGAKFKRSWRFPARIGRISVLGHEVLVVKPQTFMNRSGDALVPIVRRMGLNLSDLIVVFDDADLEKGKIRLRKKGGAGGHNGIRSIIDALGSDEFARIRIGIGPRPGGEELVHFVLSRFTRAERDQVEPGIHRAAEAVGCILEEGMDKAMNTFNEKNS